MFVNYHLELDGKTKAVTSLSSQLGLRGFFYGALPARDGLWASAAATSKDLTAPLAVEHCVHEARGLDVLPTNISRFRNGGDDTTADMLDSVVYPEEITHCAAGVKWGTLKPPFNEEARKAAGFGPRWYEPLAVKFPIMAN
ncbi:unnamed protein product [Prunus armeniaca]|uniref:Uncharacterized protein n=1 Tax=Prunus armeniaca TaxID=36596 RepID=A0A6J5U2R1_PRUAR|nr:unnamed protein product [Prunus armeniaca]